MKLLKNVEWIDVTKTDMRQISYPAIAQLKLDGELICWDGYEGRLWNSYNNEKTWVNTADLPKDCMLFGELYYDEGKDFYQYLRNQFSRELKVRFFDVVSYRGTVLYGVKTYGERFKVLMEIPCQVVDSYLMAKNENEISGLYKEMVKKGYEGLVVKPECSYTCKEWVKLKRIYHDTLLVIGARKGKSALLVGTKGRAYGAVSTLGWQLPLRKAFTQYGFKRMREDKDYVYVETCVAVEVKHYGFCGDRERERKLRNPSITKIYEKGANLTLA